MRMIKNTILCIALEWCNWSLNPDDAAAISVWEGWQNLPPQSIRATLANQGVCEIVYAEEGGEYIPLSMSC